MFWLYRSATYIHSIHLSCTDHYREIHGCGHNLSASYICKHDCSPTLSSSIGQFFRAGVQVHETVGLLLLPSMPPVPVTSRRVWRFMERDSPSDQQCWEALNPGHQGKKLIEGHYLDYTVKHILSHDFCFSSGGV